MPSLLDLIGLALLSLRGQWLRALLSVIGISIGIAAFTITSSINQGGRDLVFSELQTFGLRAIWVQRSYPTQDMNSGQYSISTGIDNDDAEELLSCCHDIAHSTPIVYAQTRLSVQLNGNVSQSQVLGVGKDYTQINADVIANGRAFNLEDERDARPVALIGSKTREDLFEGRISVVGALIQIGGRSYQVVGTLEAKNRDFLNSIGIGKDDDPNRRILLPYTTLQQEERRENQVDQVQLQTSLTADTDLVAAKVIRLLNRNHGHRYQYRSENMQKYTEAADRIVSSISWVGVCASVMSLLVGAIGIANVMGMAVLERTKEIGIRKAFGATHGAILLQFALEAIAIGVIGGVLGVGVSYAALGIAHQFTPLAVQPSLLVVFYAVAVAALAGAFAGMYPSHMAATMKPTDALRT